MSSQALTNRSISSNSSSSLVVSITKILQSLKPIFPSNNRINTPLNIESLSQFSPHLNPTLVIEVINNQTNPYHALLFFRWASIPFPNPANYSHNFSCYIAMVDLLLSHRLFTTATLFLQSHNMFSDFMISKLIKAFGVEHNIRGAIDLFHQAKVVAKDCNCISSLNSLLGVLTRVNRIKLASAIFYQVAEEGIIRLDVITYTTMIRGYCKVGKIEDAQKLFDKMPCRPNKITYNTLLHGFCKMGMMVEARQIVDKMLMNQDCLPDLVAYTTLVDGYCKKGDMEKAMMCLDEMVGQGFEPNSITYNAIVNGFCLIGKVDEAKKMMTKMRLDGVKDNVVTHTSLLRGFCIVGRLDEAVTHLKDMISLGVKPDVQTYGLLVDEFCKLRKAYEAIALLRDMVERSINPSVSSFNAVLKVLVERGELNEAVLLLNWMREIGCAPNYLSYLTVIPSLSKTGRRVQQVEELVNYMLREDHKLDRYMYSCLTMMYSECGELETASQVFSDALRGGYLINLDSFEAFVEGLCLKGMPSYAEQHAQELLKRCSDTQLDRYQHVLNKLKSKYSGQKW